MSRLVLASVAPLSEGHGRRRARSRTETGGSGGGGAAAKSERRERSLYLFMCARHPAKHLRARACQKVAVNVCHPSIFSLFVLEPDYLSAAAAVDLPNPHSPPASQPAAVRPCTRLHVGRLSASVGFVKPASNTFCLLVPGLEHALFVLLGDDGAETPKTAVVQQPV